MATTLLKNYQSYIYIVLLMLTLLCASSIHAQDNSSAQVLDARYDADDNLIIHVQSVDPISNASITIDEQSRALTIAPDSLAVDHWIILDAGESMVDAYLLVQDELLQQIDVASDNYRIGMVTVANDIRRLEPSNDPDEIRPFLNNYRAIPFEEACFQDVLDDLSNIPRRADSALTITLITGQVEDNPACDPIEVINHPINIILVGQASGTSLTQQGRLAGGQIRSASLLQLASLFDDLPNNTDSIVYALTLDLDTPIDSAELQLDLANGETITQTIRPSGQFISTQIADTSATDTIQMTSTPDATEIPTTDTPSATPIPQPDSPIVSDGLSNMTLILIGGGASILVIIVVMALLLGVGRQPTKADSLQSIVPLPLSDSTIDPVEVVARLDQTEVVTMREMASQLGPTHVANLMNKTSDLVYEIHRPLSLLGRQVGSDILIADDNQISREHVRFETRDNGSIWIVRLTNNPILVNGVPMENTSQLNDGDLIQLSPNLQVMFSKIMQGAN